MVTEFRGSNARFSQIVVDLFENFCNHLQEKWIVLMTELRPIFDDETYNLPSLMLFLCTDS